MTKQKIFTNNAPQALGSYEQAIKVGNMVYTSGQIGLNPDGILVGDDIISQTNQVMKNLIAVLESAGTNLDNAVKATIFIKDMNQFATIDEIYRSYFNENFPARSCVEVARLPKDVLIEIEMIAIA